MIRRPAAAAVVAAVALSVTTLAAPAHAAPDDRAASWLADELGRDRLFTVTFEGTDYVDHGLTVDTGLAFDELDRDRRVRQIRRALRSEMSDYSFFGAGAVAKGLVWAQVSGADPRSYADVDWIARLEEHTADSGRISDNNEPDHANTIGQAFAVRGLWEARSPERQEALRFLVKQQCGAGWFRLNFSASDAADQTCDGGDGGNAADTDVTALAVLALETLPRRNKKANRAVRRATDWLKERQKRNGSFTGGPTTNVSNANSTGLAAWALGEVGACGRAERAADWVKKIQVRGKLRGTPYAGDKGAVAYDRAAYRTGGADGITDKTRDQWRRTTAQAAVGLRHVKGC